MPLATREARRVHRRSALHTPLHAGLAFLGMTIANFGVAIAVPIVHPPAGAGAK